LALAFSPDSRSRNFSPQDGKAAASHLAVSEMERRVLFPQQLLFRRFGQLHNGCCRYGIAGAIGVSCVKLELPDRADALAD
jgi:hypothetical protein